MFQKTRLKKGYLGAIGMAFVLLLVNTLGILIQTAVDNITKPSTGSWADFAVSSLTKGSGTSSDHYIIDTAEELAYFSNNNPSGNVYIDINSDIDLGGHQWKPITVASSTYVYIYGNNHTISNLNIVSPTTDNVGLFANSTYGFLCQDLVFSNVSIWGKSYCGVVGGHISIGQGLKNISVTSGTILGEGMYVGGLIGSSAGSFNYNNCVVNAKVKGSNYVGGIAGSSGTCKNCIFTGEVIGTQNVGGIAGHCQSIAFTNCFAEAKVSGNGWIGGICGQYGKVISSGFKGEINITGTSARNIGSILGVSASGAQDKIENSFGIAEIFMNGNDIGAVHKFGATADGTEGTYKSTYSYSKIYGSNTVTEERKYKSSNDETTPFSDWAVHKNINGGYPFPKSLFSVGQFIESDVKSYLKEYKFYMVDAPVIKNDGKHYYVELGQYPQTYVGDSLNSTLKMWVGGGPGSSVIHGTFTNDLGTSDETVTNNVHKYTDGKYYVRVKSAIVTSSSGYKTQDESATLTSGNEYWFKLEPIKWWVLNYTDVQKGADPILLAEQALTSNVVWNKTTKDKNLWSGTCHIRDWLNGQFYKDAFAGGYDDFVAMSTIKNSNQSSDGGEIDTEDNIWLLSIDELNGKYTDLNSSTKLLCSPTDYALVNKINLYVGSDSPTEIRPNGGTCNWWTRSVLSSVTTHVTVVNTYGATRGEYVPALGLAVRPALTLSL